MTAPYPWPSFWRFAGLGSVAGFLSIPFPPPAGYVLLLLVALVAAIGVGLFLAQRAGIHFSMFGQSRPGYRASWLSAIIQSGLIGVGLGGAILVLVRFIYSSPLPVLLARFRAEADTAAWKRLLIAFDSGVLEELLFRLLFFSALVWLLSMFWNKRPGLPSTGILWTANVTIAVGFGLAHLPQWAAAATLTPMLALSVIFLNSIGGLTFGWLYWRNGLEAAMIAHFAADVVLHVFGTQWLVS